MTPREVLAQVRGILKQTIPPAEKVERIHAATVPVPPPPPTWGELHWQPRVLSDWQVLNETFGKGKLTDMGSARFRYEIAQHNDSVRLEVHSWPEEKGASPVPGERAYEFDLMIPSECNLSHANSSGLNSIGQHRTNQGCFTGATSIHADSDIIGYRIKGGETIDGSGACVHGYDQFHEAGQIVRDKWHRIRIQAKWDATDGQMMMWVDGKLGFDVDAPTVGRAGNGEPEVYRTAFRLGPYLRDVPAGGFVMETSNVRVFA